MFYDGIDASESTDVGIKKIMQMDVITNEHEL